MSTFDDMMAQFVPMFMDVFGTTGMSYTPQGGIAKTIKAIKVDEFPRKIPGPNATDEFQECEVLIRSDDNALGHVAPKICAYGGDAGDRVADWLGLTWYVCGVDSQDPQFHKLTLRTKPFPLEG